MMCGSNFKWLIILLVTFGVLVEVDNAYKQSVGLSNIVMPAVTVQRIPIQFRDTVTELPVVREFDRMTITTGMVMSWSD